MIVQIATQYVTPALVMALAGAATVGAHAQCPSTVELSSLAGANGFVINGLAEADRLGRAVACAGDVNGDGRDDIIVAAPYADPGGRSGAGICYIITGSPNVGASGVFHLSSINPVAQNGLVINGIDAFEASGASVAGAGDVNGDGFDDVIIGAPLHESTPPGRNGRSYVVFGEQFLGLGGPLELSDLNGGNGFALIGTDIEGQSGSSVSGAGDVNGDGFDDIVIGAKYADVGMVEKAGASYVVFGSPTVGASGSIDLGTLNGANGFVVNGIAQDDNSGWDVGTAGDVNGDGFDDLLITAVLADPSGESDAGQSYVIFGGVLVGLGGTIDLATLSGADGFAINGATSFDQSGFAASAAGDVNGDGFDDIIIGANIADPGGRSGAGASYILFGGVNVGGGGLVELGDLDGTVGFVLNGIMASDLSGAAVSAAGDVNGDGFDDVITCAYSADRNGKQSVGESYVVFGRPGLGAGGVIELSSLNGGTGFRLRGIDANDRSGTAVASAGDLNGDGLSDLLIGAPGGDVGGVYDTGEAYVLFGQLTNIWVSPSGGLFDTPGNWRCGVVPQGGTVIIDTPVGIDITGPVGTRTFDQLTLRTDLGRTTLSLRPGSVLAVEQFASIDASAALTGNGTLACGQDLVNFGVIEMEDMSIFVDGGMQNRPGARIEAIEGFIDTDFIENYGDINLQNLTNPAAFTEFELTGELRNSELGEILVFGNAVMQLSGGLSNSGSTGFVDSQSIIYGDVLNAGAPDGLGGFDPLGIISASASSDLILTGDVTNQSIFILTGDSTLIILGTLSGNGISGPGGSGTAGSVFVEGGVLPGTTAGNSPTTAAKGGAIGAARFDGDLDLGNAGTTIIEIAGSIPGVSYDQVVVAGQLGVGGKLELRTAVGFTPIPGDVYQVLDAGSIVGAFTSITLDQALLDAMADTSELLISGTISIPAGCAGDASGDGLVNVLDLNIVLGNFQQTGAPGIPGDLNGDGVVNITDLNQVLGNFQNSCP